MALTSQKPGEKLKSLQDFGKIVFCKRRFDKSGDLPSNAMEIHLLYAQAAHYAVQVHRTKWRVERITVHLQSPNISVTTEASHGTVTFWRR